MRILLLFLVSLLLGAVLGILADRTPETRALLDEIYQPASSLPAASPYAPLPDLGGLYYEAREPGGIYDREDLATYGIKNCFYGWTDPMPLERPWLERSILGRGLTDMERPENFPELSDYPGLLKIEIIHSKLGSDREHCSAVRVDKHWFLTAAHCFETENPGRALPTFDAIAITPSLDVRSEGTQVVPIKGALCHAEHGVSRHRYSTDIALFYIEDVSVFENVEIAPLEHGGLFLNRGDFETAYISGWGRNGGSRYLQGGPVKVTLFGESVLVSERIGSRGPNVGDSGAPLYVDYGQGPLVVGILSQVTQDKDTLGETGIYIRAKSIRDWVARAKKVCEHESNYIC